MVPYGLVDGLWTMLDAAHRLWTTQRMTRRSGGIR